MFHVLKLTSVVGKDERIEEKKVKVDFKGHIWHSSRACLAGSFAMQLFAAELHKITIRIIFF